MAAEKDGAHGFHGDIYGPGSSFDGRRRSWTKTAGQVGMDDDTRCEAFRTAILKAYSSLVCIVQDFVSSFVLSFSFFKTMALIFLLSERPSRSLRRG